MAPYTYYYLFSLIAVAGIVLWFANLLYLRTKGGTTFGIHVKLGSPEYKRAAKLASNRNIATASILGLVFLASLIDSMNRLVRLGTQDARSILIFAPIAVVVMFFAMILVVRKQISNYQLGRRG